MDLRTDYMGFELGCPLVVGASPLSESVDNIRALEDAGAGAVVMHSLFMEQLVREQLEMHEALDYVSDASPEALSFLPEINEFNLGPDAYLEQVARLVAAVDIPVIASLNGTVAGDWTMSAARVAQAGADGLELNIYYLPLDGAESPEAVERRLTDIVRQVRAQVELPLAVKLTYFFSSPVHLAHRLAAAGADALVLFNRVFLPDIDIDALEIHPHLTYSDSSLLKLRLLWLGAMFGRVEASLAVTGGVHEAPDVIKAVMAGASVTQMTSALLRGGPAHLARVRAELAAWLEEREYDSLRQMRGSMSWLRCPDPEAYERANYIRTLQRWRPA